MSNPFEDDQLRFAKVLKRIYYSDKTEYDYHGKRAYNRFGELPEGKGKRWKTPAEIAFDEVRELGYDHPSYIPEDTK